MARSATYFRIVFRAFIVWILTVFNVFSADLNSKEPREVVHAEKDLAATLVDLVDLDVVDQDGLKRRFKSEVVGNRLVAMNFVFTTCQTVCPTQSLILKKLQALLADDPRKDVVLISISVDPKTDVPAQLKLYAQRLGAKSGWKWITGEKANVDRVLRGAGAYSGTSSDHPAMIIVGDPIAGTWTRFNGFPRPEQLARRIAEFRTARIAKGLSQ